MMSALGKDVGEASEQAGGIFTRSLRLPPDGQIAMCSLGPDRLFPDSRLLFPRPTIRTPPDNLVLQPYGHLFASLPSALQPLGA